MGRRRRREAIAGGRLTVRIQAPAGELRAAGPEGWRAPAAPDPERQASQEQVCGWTLAAIGSRVPIRGDVAMDTQQIVEAFRRLPAEERARLVEELWDEVARELEQQPLGDAQQRLLDERIRQHEENPADVEDWKAARDDLLRDL